jgi:hypothetical protein
MTIYSTGWPSELRIAEPYRDLMERQVVIELAVGIARKALVGWRSTTALGGLAVHPRMLKIILQYQSVTEIAAGECPVSVPAAGLAHGHRHKHAPPHRRLDGRAPRGIVPAHARRNVRDGSRDRNQSPNPMPNSPR